MEIGDLLTYETDKATFEEESQHSGVVLIFFLKKGTMSQYSPIYVSLEKREKIPPYIHPIPRETQEFMQDQTEPTEKKKSTFMGMNRKGCLEREYH